MRARTPGASSPLAAIGRWGALLLLPIAAGCAPPAGVTPSPQTVIFAPARTTATLALDNREDRPVPLARLRLDPQSPDWGSFVILDRRLPKEVPAGGRVEIHMAADLEHFITDHAPGQPVRYRRGQARLLAQVDGEPVTIPIRFDPAQGGDLGVELARAGVFALLLGLVLAALRRGRALAAPPWLLVVTLAMLPFGRGLCYAGLGSPLGPADLEQCAAGHGGTPLSWLHPEAGLLLWFVTLLVLDLAAWARAVQGSAPASALRQASRRLVLDLALVLGATAVAAAQQGSFDLAAIAAEPRWGVVHAPVAALIVTLAQSLRRGAVPTGLPEDLDRAAFAGLLTVLLLGGGALPGAESLLLGLPHAAAVVLGALVVVLKASALWWLLRALDRRRGRSRAWTSPRALGVLVLVALAHLVVTAAVAGGS